MNPEPEKRPRQYAAEIARMRTVEERRAALEQVPVEMRGLVECHVRNAFALSAARKKEAAG